MFATKSVKVSQITVSIGGPLSPEMFDRIEEIVVDQSNHLPGMFMIRFADADLTLVDGKQFDLTKPVEISALTDSGASVPLITGEVTAIEPLFLDGMHTELVVRGYDLSHRLYRNQISRAYLNIRDSDIATQVAAAAGLTPAVTATTAIYEHVFQNNQSDLEFLRERAWRIGYECFVDNGTLYFRPPPPSGGGITLTWGANLLSFEPSMTLGEQVDDVTVRGWDPEMQMAIVGTATMGAIYPKLGGAANGASLASPFGIGKAMIVDQPVATQAEATQMAQARLNERSGTFVQANGRAHRRPDIAAGKFVTLENLGTRFSGTYLVTGAQHRYTHGGLYTEFTVSGSRSQTVASQMGGHKPQKTVPHVVIGIVTDTMDLFKQGRVKVKYPWLDEMLSSNWARIVGTGAGAGGAGFYAVPQVNDEVLLAFEQGDFNRPIIIGGLWSTPIMPPDDAATAMSSMEANVRVWQSPTGHKITMRDDATSSIAITTSAGHNITLDDTMGSISVTSVGGNSVKIEDMAQLISVTSMGDIRLTSMRGITMSATTAITMNSPVVTVNGATTTVNATATTMNAATTLVNSAATTVTGAKISLASPSISLGPVG
ncbi:MAG: VgrG-related protein [Candidatus Promineifilaceae bacterium]